MLKFSAIAIAITLSTALHTHVQAMGPDPGGHTGAGVTPETTKTDRAQVDAARQAAGSEVERNASGDNSAEHSARRSNSDNTKQRGN